MSYLKALFIRKQINDVVSFCIKNEIPYEDWKYGNCTEIRIAIDDLDDKNALELFRFINNENDILNIIDEHDYLIFWY